MLDKDKVMQMIDEIDEINKDVREILEKLAINKKMKSNRPYKICGYVGCNKLSRDNYCDEHKETIGEDSIISMEWYKII